MNFWLFMCNLILPACACVLAYLGCYTMAGWALFGGIIVFAMPSGHIKIDNSKELKELKKIVDDLKPLK